MLYLLSIMVMLRSGSTTEESVDMNDTNMSPEHFAFCLAAALKSPDIIKLLKEITHPNREEFADMISGELHNQLRPFKDDIIAKDAEIKDLKNTIGKLESKVEELEQHGRRDSLRIAGIPENTEHDDTDTAILNICQAISVDPPVEPSDIAVLHRLGKPKHGKTRQVIVRFATRNVRERVYSAKKNIKTAKTTDPSLAKIYINEDLTIFRANLAKGGTCYQKFWQNQWYMDRLWKNTHQRSAQPC